MSQARFIIGVLVIAIGLSFLFDFPLFKFTLAALIIWFGMRILTGRENRMDFSIPSETSEDELDRVLIFSGINKKYKSSDFKGGQIVAIFGGGEIDLSGVKTKQSKIELEATAIFGGLKIVIPEGWQVSSEGTGIIGAFNNQSELKGKKSVDLKIKGAAIIGGVDITN